MKFQRTYSNGDGTSSVWTFDTNHSEVNPISVEEVGIGEVAKRVEKRVVDPKKSLPKTKQKYLNPKTGKEVGYVRAKNLGLI